MMSNKKFTKVTSIVFLGLGSAIMLLPFYWMVTTSFKPALEAYRMPPTWVPTSSTLDSFRQVFATFPFIHLYLNSIIVSVCATALVVFTSSLAGYIFAKFSFKGKEIIFLFILGGMMIPFQAIMIPLFKIIVAFGLINTLTGVIVAWVISPFGIFMMRQFIHTVPSALIDSARIDGASFFGIYIRIVLPLAKPALLILALFNFLWSWNDFLWPLIIISSPEKSTIPLGLAMFILARGGGNTHLIMAGSLIAIFPVLVFFLLTQKNIVKGVVLTGLKG